MKNRAILILTFACLMLGCLAVPMHAQTSNTFTVLSFRNGAAGGTVGEMATLAQAACNPTLNCVIIFDPILNAYPQGNMPARCANCSWIDYRNPGSYTVTPTNVKVQNEVRFADQFSGADVGAKLNAAYADLPSSGTVYLAAKADGTCYSYTTPIVFNTAGKYVMLKGLAPSSPTFAGGACLNYTPNSGSGITLDWTPGTANFGQYTTNAGIDGISLINNGCITGGGCGGTANGIVFGGTNSGAQLAVISNTRVAGFGGAGVVGGSGVSAAGWGLTFLNDTFDFDATGMSFPNLIEAPKLYNVTMNADGVGLSFDNSGDLFMWGGSFDGETGNSAQCTSGNMHFSGVHWEAIAGYSDQFLNANNCSVTVEGSQFQDDNTTSTAAQLVTLAGSATATIRTTYATSNGRTITNLVTNGGSTTASVDLMGGTNIAGICSQIGQCGGWQFRFGQNPIFYTPKIGQNPGQAHTVPAVASDTFALLATSQAFTNKRLKLSDQGTCVMSSGTCGAQSLSATYSAAPACFVTYTGIGTLAGAVKVTSTTTTVTPASTTGTDSATVNWACLGN